MWSISSAAPNSSMCEGIDPRNHASSLDTEHWTQALAPGKYAMAHRLVDGYRMLGLERYEPIERGVGDQPPLFESFSEH